MIGDEDSSQNKKKKVKKDRKKKDDDDVDEVAKDMLKLSTKETKAKLKVSFNLALLQITSAH